MAKLIDLGKYSDRVKFRRVLDDPLYFAKEMLVDDVLSWNPTPFQMELLRKLAKSIKLPTNKPK